MTICVTGGAGYIGSHTCVELLAAGHDVVVIDNLDNSNEEAVRRVREISGKPVDFRRVDLLDAAAVDGVFRGAGIEAVIHFAGLKAVGESVRIPLRYYHNNCHSPLLQSGWRARQRADRRGPERICRMKTERQPV